MWHLLPLPEPQIKATSVRSSDQAACALPFPRHPSGTNFSWPCSAIWSPDGLAAPVRNSSNWAEHSVRAAVGSAGSAGAAW